MIKKRSAGKPTPKHSDFIYGVHSVQEALSAKRRKVGIIYTTKKPIKAWNKIKPLISAYTQISFVDRQTLENVSGTKEHQGIVAFVAPFVFEKQMFYAKQHQFVVMLDGIQDVGNLGAIIRSAYCAGVDGIILCRKNCAPLTASAIKASAGLAEHCKIYIATSPVQALQELKKQKYNLYLATLGQGENAAIMDFVSPTALVIGSEEAGISKEILQLGIRVLLPQRRADISYNASVAAGILFFLIGTRIGKIS